MGSANQRVVLRSRDQYQPIGGQFLPEVFPLEHQVPVEPAAQVGAGADVLWQHNVWAVVEPAFMLKFLSNY